MLNMELSAKNVPINQVLLCFQKYFTNKTDTSYTRYPFKSWFEQVHMLKDKYCDAALTHKCEAVLNLSVNTSFSLCCLSGHEGW